MDDMDLLIAEAQSLADDVLTSVDQARLAETPQDARDAMRGAVRAGEEMRNRLEEAVDFAVSAQDEARIEDALRHVEDALDGAQISLTSEDIDPYLEEISIKIEQAVAHLMGVQEIDIE